MKTVKLVRIIFLLFYVLVSVRNHSHLFFVLREPPQIANMLIFVLFAPAFQLLVEFIDFYFLVAISDWPTFTIRPGLASRERTCN